MIAKIASGYQKPDGLTVVKPEAVEDFLFPSIFEVFERDPDQNFFWENDILN